MANEMVHGIVGTALIQAEFEAVGLHLCNSQATGDLIYASSATQLTRLGIGATNTVLVVAGGIPSWNATLAGLTLTSPAINGTIATTGLTLPAVTLGGAVTGAIVDSTVGGHAIGGAADSKYQLLIRGTWDGGGSTAYGLGLVSSFTPANTISAFGLAVAPSLVKAGAGKTNPTFAGLWIADGAISGTGTVTTRIGLDITAQAGATSNYAARMDGTLAMRNATVPGASIADGCLLYTEDVAASSELKVRDEAGTITTISPHPTDVLNSFPTNTPFPWAYHSVNEYLGKEVVVNMVAAFLALEQVTGKQFITFKDIPKKSWAENQARIVVEREAEIKERTTLRKELEEKIAFDPEEKAYLEALLAVTKIPLPYVAKEPPKWMKDRGVK